MASMNRNFFQVASLPFLTTPASNRLKFTSVTSSFTLPYVTRNPPPPCAEHHPRRSESSPIGEQHKLIHQRPLKDLPQDCWVQILDQISPPDTASMAPTFSAKSHHPSKAAHEGPGSKHSNPGSTTSSTSSTVANERPGSEHSNSGSTTSSAFSNADLTNVSSNMAITTGGHTTTKAAVIPRTVSILHLKSGPV